jgi:glycosyltransferase involved in cell wall biosynthesis
MYCQGFTALKILTLNNLKLQQKVMVNLHGLEMFQISVGLKNRLQNYLLQIPARYILWKAYILVSLGGKLTGLLKRLKNKNSIILEIPNAVDNEWVETRNIVKRNNHLRFVFIGRYEKRKGMKLINSVINKLNSEIEFHFDVIGVVPDKLKLNNIRVTYHGKITDESYIKTVLDNSDCLLCPSYSEGMPTVILEAMARGCAVIATDVGAVSDLVSHSNGWLIKPGNISELTKAVLEALEISPEDLNQKKMASINLVKEKFTWDIVIDHALNIFKNIASVNAIQ